MAFPPRVPEDNDDISRAICLLGNRIASDLKDKSKQELICLIGVYPSLEQATRWKQTLKKLLKGTAYPDMSAALKTLRESKRKEQQQKRKNYYYRQRYKRNIKVEMNDRLDINSLYVMGLSNVASIDLNFLKDEK